MGWPQAQPSSLGTNVSEGNCGDPVGRHPSALPVCSPLGPVFIKAYSGF